MEAVIFDMDGVIVDSERYWHEAEDAILAEAVPDDDVAVEEITGVNVLDQFDRLQERYDVVVDKDAYFDLYDSRAEAVYTERAALMPGFHDLLDLLRRHDTRLAICSSSFRHWIAMVLDRFDLRDVFDVVVSAEDIDGPGKPEPTIYTHTAQELQVEPGQCVVVEDSEHGIVAAVDAGMVCIGYRAEHNADADLSRADQVVSSSQQLASVLRERLGA